MDALGGHLGEAAALGTALAWAGASLFFGAAARRRSAAVLNVVRIVLATVVLLLAVLAAGRGWRIPPLQFVAIGLSGVLGLALGDAAYFRSLRILGPRRAMLLMSLWPPAAAVLMVPLLNERLGWAGVLGMVVTIGGVVWAQTERDDGTEIQGSAARGVLFGVLGALGQATGYLFVKAGLGAASADAWLPAALGIDAAPGAELAGEPVDALYGTLLRMAVAAAALLAASLGRFRPAGLGAALRDGRFMAQASGGVVVGTVIGVWLSLVAVSLANTAVAGAIIATSPVLVIPLMRIVHGHRATWRGWLATLVAVVGIALLTFRETLSG